MLYLPYLVNGISTLLFFGKLIACFRSNNKKMESTQIKYDELFFYFAYVPLSSYEIASAVKEKIMFLTPFRAENKHNFSCNHLTLFL